MGSVTTVVVALVALAAAAHALDVGGITSNTCFYDFLHDYFYYYPADEDDTNVCFSQDDTGDREFRVPFMGNFFDDVYWDNNGIIWLHDGINQPCTTYEDSLPCATFPQTQASVIFPYLIDLYDHNMGNNFAGIQNDKDELAPIVADLQSSGLADVTFDPDWAFTATVLLTTPNYEAAGDEYVSYQVVLISDGEKSFVVFKYGDIRSPSTTSGSAGNPCYYPRIGFNDRENYWLYKPGVISSNSDNAIEGDPWLTETETNCGVPGLLVFDVTLEDIVEPMEGARCSGSCEGYEPVGRCPRCQDVDREANVYCERFGYCFPVGSVISTLDCKFGCKCEDDGEWDGCKPFKKDTDPRKSACLACRANGANEYPCIDADALGGVTGVYFVDSVWCGMRHCLLSTNKKVCPSGTTTCWDEDILGKLIVHKKAQSKLGFANWCDMCGE